MVKFKSLNYWYGLLLMVLAVSFTACVDDNDDTEAPFLEIDPLTLTFSGEGTQSFNISTNRPWTAQVQDDKSWVTLSQTRGEGSATVQVSVPAGINDEAKVDIQVSNTSGVLMSKTLKIVSGSVVEAKLIYNETFGTADVADKPYVDNYEGWNTTGDGAGSVVYSGSGVSIRSTGLANTDSYEGASGPNVAFFGSAPATFTVGKIALAEGQTNLKLVFGGSYSSKGDDGAYVNTFDTSKFDVSLSADGNKWSSIAYEKNNGDQDHPYWIQATADFTLTKAVSELYIRFTANEGSVYRLDDVTLSTGNGGQEVSLEGGTAPEPDPTPGSGSPIAKLISQMTDESAALEEDVEFEAIVCGDPKGGNFSYGTLYVMTEGATQAGEALSLYNNKVDMAASYSLGDKVKISLKAGTAKAYKRYDVPQVEGWSQDEVTVISSGNAVNPVTVTVDQLASYVCMPVRVDNVTCTKAGVWEKGTLKNGEFAVNGTPMNVYLNNDDRIPFIGQPYSATTGSMSGIASVYSGAGQLMPRNADDVEAFSSSEPTLSLDKTELNFSAEGGEQTINVTLVNAEGAITATGLDDSKFTVTVNGTAVTVKANPNETTEAVTGNLTIAAAGISVTVPVKVAGKASEAGYDIISELSELTAGTYLLSGYLEEYQGTTFAPYSYHIWTGSISSGSNGDLVTAAYQYEGGQLTTQGTESGTKVELEAVSGKANTYYIKVEGQYLYSSESATNRKLALTDDKTVAEWEFKNLADVNEVGKGITATNNGVYLVTANAASNFLRSYKETSVNANYKDAMYFFKEK